MRLVVKGEDCTTAVCFHEDAPQTANLRYHYFGEKAAKPRGYSLFGVPPAQLESLLNLTEMLPKPVDFFFRQDGLHAFRNFFANFRCALFLLPFSSTTALHLFCH